MTTHYRRKTPEPPPGLDKEGRRLWIKQQAVFNWEDRRQDAIAAALERKRAREKKDRG